MEWKFELIGDKQVLSRLSNAYEDITFVEEEGKYILLHKTNNSTDDARVIENEINKRLRSMNSYITRKYKHPLNKVDYERFYYTNENGFNQYFEKVITVHIKIQANVKSVKEIRDGITTETHNPFPKLKSWDYLTQTDKYAKWVSDIINDEPTDDVPHTFITLYKILDVLIEDGFIDSHDKKGTYFHKIKIFTHTANSYSATKEGSRHAQSKTPPPIPMLLDEAKLLFDRILDDWIDYKITKMKKE